MFVVAVGALLLLLALFSVMVGVLLLSPLFLFVCSAIVFGVLLSFVSSPPPLPLCIPFLDVRAIVRSGLLGLVRGFDIFVRAYSNLIGMHVRKA